VVAKSAEEARKSAIPMPVQTPTGTNDATGTSGLASDYTQFLKNIAKNPALISGYSRLLKTAGYYKGKVTSKYTPALQAAFNKAEEARMSIFAVNPMDRDTFLTMPVDTGTGGSGGPNIVKNVTVFTPELAKNLIEEVIRGSLGRNATTAEIKKYTTALAGIQDKAATVTKYSTSGGVQTAQVTPGIDQKQYLVDQIAKTDESKANQVLGYYETFMNALGGR